MHVLDFMIERKLLKIGHRLYAVRDKALERHGITASLSEALLFFAANEGSHINMLQEHLQISHQATRNLVARLKTKGFIFSAPSPRDGRARQITLTERGRRLYRVLLDEGSLAGRTLLDTLTVQEKNELSRLLAKIDQGAQ